MNRLKFLREEKGIFQKDIANYLDCSIAIISMYEKEQRIMDVNIAQKLAEYFNVSIDYLLGKSNIRAPKEEESSWLSDFMDNYVPPSEKQKQQIRELVDVILKENKKDK